MEQGASLLLAEAVVFGRSAMGETVADGAIADRWRIRRGGRLVFAESLRLEEASVVALEEGRFDAMGASVFVRGHLRRYAQLVGLPEEQVLEAYRAAVPDSDALDEIGVGGDAQGLQRQKIVLRRDASAGG